MIRGRSGRWRFASGPTGTQPVEALAKMEVPVDVVIRLAEPADIAGLEAWEGFDTPAHRRALRYYLTMQNTDLGAFLVAVVGDYPVAQLFLWYHRDDPTLADGHEAVSITALRVRSAFRKRGIASRMGAVAEAMARERGFTTITIGTDVDNDPALRLYLSWGYTEFKRSMYEWDGKTFPQICLRKSLALTDTSDPAAPAPPNQTR
jgi:ribosomal protein S18 acetylase RimI-like enzyme